MTLHKYGCHNSFSPNVKLHFCIAGNGDLLSMFIYSQWYILYTLVFKILHHHNTLCGSHIELGLRFPIIIHHQLTSRWYCLGSRRIPSITLRAGGESYVCRFSVWPNNAAEDFHFFLSNGGNNEWKQLKMCLETLHTYLMADWNHEQNNGDYSSRFLMFYTSQYTGDFYVPMFCRVLLGHDLQKWDVSETCRYRNSSG